MSKRASDEIRYSSQQQLILFFRASQCSFPCCASCRLWLAAVHTGEIALRTRDNKTGKSKESSQLQKIGKCVYVVQHLLSKKKNRSIDTRWCTQASAKGTVEFDPAFLQY